MADQRIVAAFVLTDPTTPSQQAGVDSSGNLKVIAAANDGVDIGNVDVASVIAGTGATNLGKAEDAAHASGDTGVAVWAVRRDTLTVGSGSDGDYSPFNVDANGRLYSTSIVTGDALTALEAIETAVEATEVIAGAIETATEATQAAVESLVTINGAIETAVELIDDAIYTGGSGTPSKGILVLGSDGTNPQPITTDGDGHLQVDILSGAGNSSPTNPAVSIPSAATIAAGSSSNLDSSDLVTKKLHQAVVSGSVPFKVVISTLSNGSATAKVTLFGGPGNPVVWAPPHPDFAVSGSGAGADGFRAAVTNLDASDSADFYASFFYAD